MKQLRLNTAISGATLLWCFGLLFSVASAEEIGRFEPQFQQIDGEIELDPQIAEGASTHKLRRYRFKNEEGVSVNDLHVVFNRTHVKTKDSGPFDDAETLSSKIVLQHGTVNDKAIAKIVFEANGKFKIKKWWWTLDGERVGAEKEEAPDS